MNTEKRLKTEVILPVVLTIVLLVPNIINIFEYGVESAEAFSVKMGNMTTTEMLHATAREIHPPLYYAMLHAAILLFGNSVYVYRILSVIPYFLTIWYAFRFLKKEFGPLCTAVFLTCASLTTTALNFNTHIRNYSWPAFLVLLAFHELYMILRDGRRRDYILLAVYTALAGYLLYYALLPLFVLYAFLLVFLIAEKDRQGLRNWLISAALAIGLYLPWLTVFFRSLQSVATNYWMTEVAPFASFYKSLFSARFSVVWPTLWLLTVLILVFRDKTAPRENGDTHSPHGMSVLSRWLVAGVIAVFGSIAIGFAVSALSRPIFNERYIYPASVIAWVSLAAGAEKLKYKKYHVPVLLAVFLLFQLMAYGRMLTGERIPADNQIRHTVEAVRACGTEGAVIVSQYALGGLDDEIVMNLGFDTSPMGDYYFRGITEELRIDPEKPGDWPLSPDKRYFLFLYAPLSGEEIGLLTEKGMDCRLLVEDGNIRYTSYVVYYLTGAESKTGTP